MIVNKVDQEFLAGNPEGIPGDCVRACVATILGLERDQVPHFVRLRGAEWKSALIAWCYERGLEADWENTDTIINYKPVMLCGPSPRSGRHAVVAINGTIVHDPHPSRAGLRMERRKEGIDALFYFESWTFEPC